MRIDFGPSANGRTTYVRGGRYYTLQYANEMLPDAAIEKPLPAKLAWTKMNTSWKKGKR